VVVEEVVGDEPPEGEEEGVECEDDGEVECSADAAAVGLREFL